MKNNKLYVLCGPSGSGKDTILNELIKSPIFNVVKQYTTRPKRIDEKNKNYHFVDKKTFFELEKQEKILGATSFNNWYYGIDKESISDEFCNIIILNPIQIQLLKNKLDMIIFYLMVSDRKRLIRTLNRGDDINEVIRRYKADSIDFLHFINNEGKIIEKRIFELSNEDDNLQHNVGFIKGFIVGDYNKVGA